MGATPCTAIEKARGYLHSFLSSTKDNNPALLDCGERTGRCTAALKEEDVCER